MVCERFGIDGIRIHYGASESGPCTVLPAAQSRIRPSSIGKRPADVDVKSRRRGGRDVAPGEVGELAVRSDYLMSGLFRGARGDGPGAAGRLVPHRRPGGRGRRGLPVRVRAAQGRDPVRRREHLSRRSSNARSSSSTASPSARSSASTTPTGGRRPSPRSCCTRGRRSTRRRSSSTAPRTLRATSGRATSCSSRRCPRRERPRKCKSRSCASGSRSDTPPRLIADLSSQVPQVPREPRYPRCPQALERADVRSFHLRAPAGRASLGGGASATAREAVLHA